MQSKLESKIEEQWRRSKIIDPEKENALPRFTMDQLEKGKFLGKGGFCTVDEIKRFRVDGGASSAKRRGAAASKMNRSRMKIESSSSSTPSAPRGTLGTLSST